jgi:hypothetical protein
MPNWLANPLGKAGTLLTKGVLAEFIHTDLQAKLPSRSFMAYLM